MSQTEGEHDSELSVAGGGQEQKEGRSEQDPVDPASRFRNVQGGNTPRSATGTISLENYQGKRSGGDLNSKGKRYPWKWFDRIRESQKKARKTRIDTPVQTLTKKSSAVNRAAPRLRAGWARGSKKGGQQRRRGFRRRDGGKT